MMQLSMQTQIYIICTQETNQLQYTSKNTAWQYPLLFFSWHFNKISVHIIG